MRLSFLRTWIALSRKSTTVSVYLEFVVPCGPFRHVDGNSSEGPVIDVDGSPPTVNVLRT